MANALYDSCRKGFLDGDFDWVANTHYVYLIDTGAYTYSAAHDFFDDVAGGAVIAGPATLSGKTSTGGSADATDVTFSAVSGVSIEAILITQFVTVASDSPVMVYIDTATGLPITPNGGDIIVTWDNGTNKIFRV